MVSTTKSRFLDRAKSTMQQQRAASSEDQAARSQQQHDAATNHPHAQFEFSLLCLTLSIASAS